MTGPQHEDTTPEIIIPFINSEGSFRRGVLDAQNLGNGILGVTRVDMQNFIDESGPDAVFLFAGTGYIIDNGSVKAHSPPDSKTLDVRENMTFFNDRLIVDYLKRTLIIDGTETDVTRTEFEIVSVLTDNANRFLTRSAIGNYA